MFKSARRLRKGCGASGIVSVLTLVFTAHAWAAAPAASGTLPALIPQPRELAVGPRLSLDRGLSIDFDQSNEEDRFAADDLRAWCVAIGVPVTRQQVRERDTERGVHVRLQRRTSTSASLLAGAGLRWDDAMHDEGYVLLPDKNGMTLLADTAEGLFYAVQTLKQLVHHDSTGAWLQSVAARDWPAMRYRGFSDDVTRGGVPTMGFFKQQIRTFAAYKLNVYSLYLQTSFQYVSDPSVPPPGGALTPAEARELTEYAHKYHVALIPEQESFAHLHSLLTSQHYADLAETPLGGVLAPGQPRSLRVIESWFSELSTAFPGDMLHIGADETFDLGKGQTAAAVRERGLPAVYVDFLVSIHSALAPLHRRLLFWGDVAVNAPEQVKRLPKDMIAVTWVYEPHPEGYAKWITPFQQNAIETWVAPGVSNWRRVYPDFADALANIQGFVAAGQAAGSTGVLNTGWNDEGEELPAMNWFGILFGAAAGWQKGTTDTEVFAQNFGAVFHGDASDAANQAQSEMMLAAAPIRHDKLLERSLSLFWVDPWSPAGRLYEKRLGPHLAEMRTHAENATGLAIRALQEPGIRQPDALDALELGARKMDFLAYKFQAASRIAELYDEAYRLQSEPGRAKEVGELLRKIGGPNGLCQDLRDGYNEIGRIYAELWSRQYRPYFLANITNRYAESGNLWQSRSNRFMEALLLYQQGGKLPPLSSIMGFEPAATDTLREQRGSRPE